MTTETLTITHEDLARWKNERRAAEPPIIRDGQPEDTGFDYVTWQDRPTRLQVLVRAHNWVRITRERWGRKRFETWFDVEGRQMGRWWWVPEERYRPAGSPPLPQRCVRDTLEDEMGYEEAVAYIGHREATMGIPRARSSEF